MKHDGFCDNDAIVLFITKGIIIEILSLMTVRACIAACNIIDCHSQPQLMISVNMVK